MENICYTFFEGGEKMSKYYDDKAKERTMRYMKEKRDRITVGVPKGDKERYMMHAKSKGMSLNAYVVRLIEDDIKNSGS